MRFYLYGESRSEVVELMDDPGFRELARDFFESTELKKSHTDPELLLRAVEAGMLEIQDDKIRPGTRLVVLPGKAEDHLNELWSHSLNGYVEIASRTARRLKAAYDDTRVSREFSWRQVQHSVVAGMFLDMSMGNELLRHQHILRDPRDTVVWLFERRTGQNAFGVRWFPGEDREMLVQLWHQDVDMNPPRLGPAHVQEAFSLARGHGSRGDLKTNLYLAHLKLARRSGSDWQLTFPAFLEDDAATLLPSLRDAAEELVANTLIPALDVLEQDPWWRKRSQHDRYRHAAVRLFLDYGMDRVMKAGVLPSFAESNPPTPSWGRWLWCEGEVDQGLFPIRRSDARPTE